MSVFKRNGVGNYYIQFNYNGKTYCKSSKTTNKRTAERMERDWREELHRIEELGERPRITFKDALQCYATSKQNTGSSEYARHNLNAIESRMDATVYLDELRDWDLNKFKSLRESEGMAPQTIKHNLQAIRSTVAWAKDHGYRVPNLEFPRVRLQKHRLRYLSFDEEARLLADLDPKRKRPYRPDFEYRPESENRMYQDNYDLVVLLLDTGARYGEIANIKWSAINLESGTINLWRPKVRNESIIYMTSRVKEILHRRSETKVSNEYLFTNQEGQPRGYQSKGIRAAFKRAGIEDFKIHDLRHTCATRLIRAGLSLYDIQAQLGHAQCSTTSIYTHLSHQDVSMRARDILDHLNRASSDGVA
ncbi:tyrosine-type recombinase/integrase [Shewanella fodinae]|uniref:tyrosine-type recombinase/integrase n=1 Tax=Shewanella fodinae TaxID=552357 RepID=UPI0016770EF2|nr:site-specific integrase [Shewanella fodinae]MCL2908099.1 site-specific integrase [Shewanella fodinae]GGZ01205.1 integrase [Shewanella fodinae]